MTTYNLTRSEAEFILDLLERAELNEFDELPIYFKVKLGMIKDPEMVARFGDATSTLPASKAPVR